MSAKSDGTINLRRSQILRIVLIAKDVFRKDLPINKALFTEHMDNAKALGFKRVDEIENLKWGMLRDILRNMKKKYNIDKKGFEDFLAEARCLWRTENGR